jgi:3-oxoadipate enol-lactonase
VVLLHGWTATATMNWFRCVDPLSERFRVLALDHRGHGRGVRSRRRFRLDDCADDVAELVGALDCGPVVAAGYSMGGPVAQLLWRRHPKVVRGLVLCATADWFVRRSAWRDPVGAIGLGLAMALTVAPNAWRDRAVDHMIRRRLAAGEVSQWAIDEWARHDPAALIQAGIALRHFDSSGWLSDIDVPTAVVLTERDTTVPPSRQHALAAAIPGAQVLTVDADHRACAGAAELFVPALVEACSRVCSPGTDQRRASSTDRAAFSTAGP